jgi:predicted N-acetyltransferase YhbS
MGNDFLIRREAVADYAALAALHAHAFGKRAGEALIVALLRQRRAFDPALSLVAESAGRIVGHALFSPYQLRLLDRTLPAVNLAPIAVAPARQREGIGGMLIRAGHALAAARGYTISFLLGHPMYYPRFGYQTHAFGSAQLVLPVRARTERPLETREPAQEDLAALCALWRAEESGVDMALEPGNDLLDWLSPDPAIQATIYLRAGQLVGYTRCHRDEPTSPRVFLARDNEAASRILATRASSLPPGAEERVYTLPLHPFSRSTPFLGRAESIPQAAAMVCELAASPLPDYLAAIREQRRPVGRLIWPVAFDLV